MAGLELDTRVYRVLLGLIIGRPSNFSWLIENKVAGSGLPVGERGYRWLRDHGVSAILCLTEDTWGKAHAEKLGMQYMHIPMLNRQPEIPRKLDQAVDAITSTLNQGKSILIHCQAGQGRTGMVLAAYLIREKGLTADEAIKHVRNLRTGSLKREKQVKALHDYEEYLKIAKTS
ncbi:MAG: dual specificity protein phosphatase family protein [Conexivisphaerales archaeon]